MKKKILAVAMALLVAALGLTSGCNVVTGSGKIVTWEMDYTDFTRIQVGSGFDIDVVRADLYQVSITIDEVLYEYLDIEQRGDTLHISLKGNRTYTDTVQRAIVTLPELRRLELSGGSTGIAVGFTSDRSVGFKLSGGSTLELQDVMTGDADVALSGASRLKGELEMANGRLDASGGSVIELEGSAGDIRIEGSGASDIRLDDFPVSTADIRLSGASQASVNVINRLDIETSGASSIDYVGTPMLGTINVSGGSDINPK